MRRHHRPLFRTLLALAGAAGLVVGGMIAPVSAHETDQYSLPVGRELTDQSGYLTGFFYDTISRGVEQTNDEIRDAIKNKGDVAAASDPERVTRNINHQFPAALFLIEGLDDKVTKGSLSLEAPGRMPGYKPPPSITKYLSFPLNPFRAWVCGTINAFGVKFGTDKVGHFTDMGMHYWDTYRSALKDGKSEAQATAAAVKIGTDDPLLGEAGVLGYWTAADYSNADLIANYTGMLFYRNLTEPVRLKGVLRPPMLVKDGPYWKLAPHVARDSAFFSFFVSDHLDEALNPGHFLEGGARNMMKSMAQEYATNILEHRADEFGNRRSPQWFYDKWKELQTYYGDNYGHKGDDTNQVLISNYCFMPPTNHQLRNATGYTRLHLAAMLGDVSSVQALLSAKIDPNERVRSDEMENSAWGDTALHLAVQSNRMDVVNVLLSGGADVNASNDRGMTPLYLAVQNSAMVRRLLDAGAKVDVVDQQGQTPLHYAVQQPDCTVVAMLLDRGAPIDARDRDGATALHAAARVANSGAVATLLQRGADPKTLDEFRESALHLAALAGDRTTTDLLVSAGVDVNAVDDFGRTPLHNAARAGAEPVAMLLLQNHANPAVADDYGVTPLKLARVNGYETLTQLLRSAEPANVIQASSVTAAH